MTRVLLLLAALALSLQLAAGQSPGEGAAEQTRAELRTLLDAQAQAWNRGDLDAFMQPYWRSDSLRFLTRRGLLLGYDSLAARYRRSYGTGAEMGRLSFDLLRIDVLGPAEAVVIGRFRLWREGAESSGYFSLLWRKLAGRWVIVLDHTS